MARKNSYETPAESIVPVFSFTWAPPSTHIISHDYNIRRKRENRIEPMETRVFALPGRPAGGLSKQQASKKAIASHTVLPGPSPAELWAQLKPTGLLPDEQASKAKQM